MRPTADGPRPVVKRFGNFVNATMPSCRKFAIRKTVPVVRLGNTFDGSTGLHKTKIALARVSRFRREEIDYDYASAAIITYMASIQIITCIIVCILYIHFFETGNR